MGSSIPFYATFFSFSYVSFLLTTTHSGAFPNEEGSSLRLLSTSVAFPFNEGFIPPRLSSAAFPCNEEGFIPPALPRVSVERGGF